MQQILSVPDQLGPLIRSARKTAKLSQSELAERLGLSQSRMSAIELDPSSLSLAHLLRLFSVLGLELQVQPRGGAPLSVGEPEPQW